jgi:hypothetical protein
MSDMETDELIKLDQEILEDLSCDLCNDKAAYSVTKLCCRTVFLTCTKCADRVVTALENLIEAYGAHNMKYPWFCEDCGDAGHASKTTDVFEVEPLSPTT